MEKNIDYYYELCKRSDRLEDEFVKNINNNNLKIKSKDKPYVSAFLIKNYLKCVLSNGIESSIKPTIRAIKRAKLGVKTFYLKHKIAYFKLPDGTIMRAERITQKFPEIYKHYPFFDGHYSDRNEFYCHAGSIILAEMIKRDCEVVTGIVHSVRADAPDTHSWVETTIDGKKFVLDITTNSLMKCTDYYKFNKIDTILSRYGWKQIIEDQELLHGISDTKEYLIFRDQVLERALGKQKQ